MIVVAVSGGFDPIHVGHIRMFKEAKKLGDRLIVLVNSDTFLKEKKGKAFMSLDDRIEIIKELECVDEAYPVIDEDNTVCKTLSFYKPNIFANGGDRTIKNVPEQKTCKELGIKMVYGIGGEDKARSSSELLNKYKKG